MYYSYECDDKESCIGGLLSAPTASMSLTSNQRCAIGHASDIVLCGRCSFGYAFETVSGKCTKCSGKKSDAAQSIVIFVILVFVILSIIVIFIKRSVKKIEVEGTKLLYKFESSRTDKMTANNGEAEQNGMNSERETTSEDNVSNLRRRSDHEAGQIALMDAAVASTLRNNVFMNIHDSATVNQVRSFQFEGGFIAAIVAIIAAYVQVFGQVSLHVKF